MRSTGSSVSWRTAVSFPGVLGTVAFTLYATWNVRWLLQGAIPPSILSGLTGLPAPTTGMTRSTLAFIEGNGSAAFLWNPFTLPFIALLVLTVAEMAWKWTRQRPLVLSKPLALAWPLLLTAAWVTKLVLGPQWW